MGGEAAKKGKLVAMHKYLAELKILADINDPMIRKRFEDGIGKLRLIDNEYSFEFVTNCAASLLR